MEIKNYTNNEKSKKYYGGNAGYKIGIIENNEEWLLKFPKNTHNLENVEMSYTTSPLSEYIGSKIYEIVGLDVHKVKLGIYDKKIVVACKDFNSDREFDFYELHEIKNKYLEENELTREEILKKSKTNRDEVNLEELLFVLDKHEDLKNILGIKERFWDMFIIDSLINNNDRHNGNWGFLVNKNEIKLAPIYDNGASFFSKHDNKKIIDILDSDEKMKQLIQNGRTPYLYRNKKVDSIQSIRKISLDKAEILEENIDLKNAIIRNVPKINIKKINKMIDEIPEKIEDIEIISPERKKFYKKFLQQRYEKILVPSYEKISNKSFEKVKER